MKKERNCTKCNIKLTKKTKQIEGRNSWCDKCFK